MPLYKYKARDKFGKLSVGSIGGDSKAVVAVHLESLGYTPVSIEEVGFEKKGSFFRKFTKVRQEDLNLFNRQLVTLIKAGLPLLAGLNAIARQTRNSILRGVIQEIIRDIERGSSFSDALARHPNVFSELYINTVKAGEIGGILDEILLRVTELGEYDARIKSKIKSATRYPIIAVTVMCIGFFVLVTFVIPRFVTIFARFHGELPLPTRILIGVNYIITNYWHITIVAIAIFTFSFVKFINTTYGRRFWDNLKLKIPIFGPLLFMIVMSRFSRIMAVMLRSGVPILGILDIVSKSTGNVVIGDAVKDIMTSVYQGKSIAETMAGSKVFSPMVVQMVAIGEETGKVDELLMRVSEHYDQQSDYMIQNLTTMIEPILILVLGAGVLLMALAIFLPMWNMIGLFTR